MPVTQEVHLDAALSNISIMYKNDEMIADVIAPRVDVTKESDKYFVFDKSNLRIEETVRADKAVANEVSYSLSTGSYQVDEHALRDIVTDRLRKNSDAGLRPDIDITEVLTEKIVLRKEFDCGALVFATSTYASGMKATTGVPIWNGSSGDAIGQLLSGCEQVAAKIGHRANTIVLGRDTFVGLQTNTKVSDSVKHTQLGSITQDILAALFQVDTVLVGRAVRNTSNEGQSDSLSDVWSDGAACLYVERNPGLRKPSFMYQFSTAPRMVHRYDAAERGKGAQYIEVSDYYDLKVVDQNAGYYLSNTVQ